MWGYAVSVFVSFLFLEAQREARPALLQFDFFYKFLYETDLILHSKGWAIGGKLGFSPLPRFPQICKQLSLFSFLCFKPYIIYIFWVLVKNPRSSSCWPPLFPPHHSQPHCVFWAGISDLRWNFRNLAVHMAEMDAKTTSHTQTFIFSLSLFFK